MSKEKINFMIDSSSLAWRAFYSMGNLSHEEVPTGVTFGFLKQIEEIYERYQPCTFAFAWDSKKSIRKKEYPEYKEKRDNITEEERKKKQEAYNQINTLRTYVLPSLGFNQSWKLTGFEADDIIAKYVLDKKYNCAIVSGDEDMYQLLNYTFIYNPAKQETLTRNKFNNVYGIAPNQWPMVKAIGGCKSDNVKGIDGVGEKKAIQYLKEEMNPSTKTYQLIYNSEDEINFYLSLVSLPHRRCPDLKPRECNRFDEEGFNEVCEIFGMETIKENKKQWKHIING